MDRESEIQRCATPPQEMGDAELPSPVAIKNSVNVQSLPFEFNVKSEEE